MAKYVSFIEVIAMYEIIEKRALTTESDDVWIKAPEIAKKGKPGQFVILRLHEKGERIPLTLAGTDPEKGLIRLIFQKVGKTTKEFGTYKVGDKLADVVGPLGNPTELDNFGNVVVIGGGLGIAIAYPVAKGFHDSGNNVISIIGARTKDLLILEDEMRAISSELHITTDDGSYGVKGFVTTVLQQLIDEGRKIDRVFAVGPVVMMKAVANVTKPAGIKTIVSLNPIMVDGTGMCGACRVTVGGKVRLACVDGPEFDAHEVDFKELTERLGMYKEEEKVSLERFQEAHAGGH